MSSGNTSGPFSDFSNLKLHLPSLRVDDLKTILRDINRQIPGAYTRLSGRKDDLVVRIEDQLLDAISTQSVSRYETIKRFIFPKGPPQPIPRPIPAATQPSTSSSATLPRPTPVMSLNRAPAPTTDFGTAPLARLASYDAFRKKADPAFGVTSNLGNNHRSGSTSHSATPQPSLKRILPIPGTAFSAPSTVRAFGGPAQDTAVLPLPFETSPFYRFDSAASQIAICQKAGQNDRRSVSLTLTLSPDQRAKLLHSMPNSSGPQYRLRLFCTSDKYFNHPSLTHHSMPVLPPAPTDFPLTCEIKFNNALITANVRGLKKQAGSAPPPDLGAVPAFNGVGQALNLQAYGTNRVEVIYTNADKRYYVIIYLVEHFTIPVLLKNLRTGRQRTKEEVLEKIKASSGDDDVFTSSLVISLVDPIVLTRIQTPIRSLQCPHLQCFDAEMFYSMMEQTPTWSCPVCSTKLKPETLAIDGYFQNILQLVSSSVDSVTVEADGTWHDDAYRYGTTPKPPGLQKACKGPSTPPKIPAKRNVMVLDLDEELENGSRKREKTNKAVEEPVCIDLTLDD